MLQDIITGISQKLHLNFGDEYAIYLDRIEQGMKRPCFFIQSDKSEGKRVLGNRFYSTNSFKITFYPASSSSLKQELEEIGRFLISHLDLVETASGIYNGTNLAYEMDKASLKFTVNYNYFVMKSDVKADFMGDYKVLNEQEK